MAIRIATLECELLERRRFRSRREARLAVFEFIEGSATGACLARRWATARRSECEAEVAASALPGRQSWHREPAMAGCAPLGVRVGLGAAP